VHGEEGTRKAILAAFVANLGIAIGKLVAGLLTGAAAMLAEAAHSFADCFNQVFLLVGLRLSGARADEDHPYGYGKDRFFWSFMAAVFIFFAGALFSLYRGARGLIDPHPHTGSFLPSYLVLGAALAFETWALLVSVRALRAAAVRVGHGFWRHLDRTRNTALKVPFYEDAAAIVGIVIAAGGLLLVQLTGEPRWDAVASLGIGVVLLFVAWEIGADSRALLLGEAMDAADRRTLREALRSVPEVERVARVLTMHLGPEDVLVNADVQVRRGLRTAELEGVIDRLNHRVHAALPQVKETFIELHSSDPRERIKARL
jgi:cation diffusion facilitator family transporter